MFSYSSVLRLGWRNFRTSARWMIPASILIALNQVLAPVTSYLSGVISFMIGGFLAAGVFRTITDPELSPFVAAKSSVKPTLKLALAAFYRSLLMMLAGLVLVVPLFIVGVGTALVEVLVYEEEKPFWEAVDESWKLLEGHLMTMFLIYSALGISFLLANVIVLAAAIGAVFLFAPQMSYEQFVGLAFPFFVPVFAGWFIALRSVDHAAYEILKGSADIADVFE